VGIYYETTAAMLSGSETAILLVTAITLAQGILSMGVQEPANI